MSQVVTFYEDEAKTNALYPRTKLSAISDDEGKALSETIDELNSKTRINYLRPTLQTQTINGVTCTNNGDGTYTLNGTATSRCQFALTDFFPIYKGEYKLLGCPEGGDGLSTYKLAGHNYADDIGDGQVFSVKSNGSEKLYIIVYSGYTCNNLVFKPMITDDLSATYDDYVSGFDCFTPDLKMDLLWENANLSSNFDAQTISLDLSNYKCFCFSALHYKVYNALSEQTAMSSIGLIDSNVGAMCVTKCNDNAGSRFAKATKTGVTFNNAYSNFTSDITTNNTRTIPYQIYGIK